MSYNSLEVDVAANYNKVLQRVESCAKISSRDVLDITVVGVSKRIEFSRIKSAIDAGLKIVGEVAGTELKKKLPDIRNYSSSTEIQIVGHLQSNKVKYSVENCQLIQSIQSEKILLLVNKFAQKQAVVYPIFLQVDFSNVLNPKGLNLQKTLKLLELSEVLANVEAKGIMTIAPLELEKDEYSLRKFFAKTNKIFQENIRPKIPDTNAQLSMGMSNDFEIAIQEGSTMVRVGTAIFGSRTS
ncbi:MAG: YggS family pyridoxal phosphate-dependent enzyme [Candidatus Heimdallarchaeota archaeon]|nr:YggS family pyridoxal phosphate-dependent enzyme [Candidatus Heimdallarchaeota archaeon]